MALIRMCVVPNYSQRLSLPILWIVTVCATYWTHTTAVCVLMVALTRLWLPTHPHHPPILTTHLPLPPHTHPRQMWLLTGKIRTAIHLAFIIKTCKKVTRLMIDYRG